MGTWTHRTVVCMRNRLNMIARPTVTNAARFTVWYFSHGISDRKTNKYGWQQRSTSATDHTYAYWSGERNGSALTFAARTRSCLASLFLTHLFFVMTWVIRFCTEHTSIAANHCNVLHRPGAIWVSDYMKRDIGQRKWTAKCPSEQNALHMTIITSLTSSASGATHRYSPRSPMMQIRDLHQRRAHARLHPPRAQCRCHQPKYHVNRACW